ncbi:hypothetical protein M5D96_010953, partial [Drosophila gunungcola]
MPVAQENFLSTSAASEREREGEPQRRRERNSCSPAPKIGWIPKNQICMNVTTSSRLTAN